MLGNLTGIRSRIECGIECLMLENCGAAHYEEGLCQLLPPARDIHFIDQTDAMGLTVTQDPPQTSTCKLIHLRCICLVVAG